MPPSRNWRRWAPSFWLSAVSRPAAGSSSRSSFGAAASARATPIELALAVREVARQAVGPRLAAPSADSARSTCSSQCLASDRAGPQQVEQERVPPRLLGGDEQVVAHA